MESSAAAADSRRCCTPSHHSLPVPENIQS